MNCMPKRTHVGRCHHRNVHLPTSATCSRAILHCLPRNPKLAPLLKNHTSARQHVTSSLYARYVMHSHVGLSLFSSMFHSSHDVTPHTNTHIPLTPTLLPPPPPPPSRSATQSRAGMLHLNSPHSAACFSGALMALETTQTPPTSRLEFSLLPIAKALVSSSQPLLQSPLPPLLFLVMQ